MYCQQCSTKNADSASRCSKCGAALWPWEQAPPGEASTAADSAVLRAIVPIGRSWVAILAGYLGLVSVLLVPAPFALAAGIAARVHLKRNPKLRGAGRAWFAIVAGGLGTVLLIGWIAIVAGAVANRPR